MIQRPFVPVYLSSNSQNKLLMCDYRMLAHVAFFPEQFAEQVVEQVVEQVEQVVEGIGGDEILAQGRNREKDGNKAKGDLEQWKVMLLIRKTFQESLSSGAFSCIGSDHVGGVLPPPSRRLHLLCHDDQRHLHPRWQSYNSQ